MAAVTTTGAGNWSSGSSVFSGGSGPGGVPSNADTVTISHAITLDTTAAVCSTLTIASGGSLIYSRSADATLTAQTTIVVQSGGTWDMGTDASPIPASYTATLILNNAAGTNGLICFTGDSGFTSITFNGEESKTRWSTLTADTVAASTTQPSIADATGWAVNDKIAFCHTESGTSVQSESRTIASLAPLTLSSALTNKHSSGSAVMSLTSNVIVKSANSSFRAKMRINIAGSTTDTFSCRYTRFENMGSGQNNGAVELNLLSVSSQAEYQARAIKSFNANIFDVTANVETGAIYLFGLRRSATIDNSVYFSPYADKGWFVCVGSQQTYTINDSAASCANIIAVNAPAGARGQWNRSHFNVLGQFVATAQGAGTLYTDCKVYGYGLGFSQETAGFLSTLTRCDLGESPLLWTSTSVNNKFFFQGNWGGNWDAELIDCNFDSVLELPATLTNQIKPLQQASFNIINKNTDTTLQRWYRPVGQVFSSTEVKRGTTSISIQPLLVGVDCEYDIKMPVSGSEAVTVAGYLKYDATFYNTGTWTAPTVELIDIDGTTVLDSYTAASASSATWLPFILEGTNGATAGTFTVRCTANPAAVTTGIVYFDGIAASPFVTKTRHFGYVFDESNPKRIQNLAITTTGYTTSDLATSEATAVGITGITVTGATSAIALGASKTFQQLYDYTQAWSCVNLAYAAPLTGSGTVGAVALRAVGNVATTGYTLNGGGSLAMGSNTLTANDSFTYTYTGGTFSQAASVPTFSGGTLNIGAAGTYTFTQAASMTVSATPTAPSNYVLSDGSFTGTLTFENTTAHAITVEVPAGVTTATSTPLTVTFVAPQLYQSVTVTGIEATYRIQLFDIEFDLTVSGITVTPTAGATYTHNGITWTVRSASITAGAGTITVYGTGTPATSGTLTKTGGTGDASVAFSAYVVDGTELYIGVPGATSYTWTDSVAAAAPRVIRVRVMEDGPGTSDAIEMIDAIVGMCGITDGTESVGYLVAAVADDVYNDRGVDGSAITGITIDDTTLRLEIASGTITNYNGTDVLVVDGRDLYAYETYWLGTTDGMRDEARFIEAIDAVNFRCSNFKLKGTSGYPIMINNCFIVDAATGIFSSMVDYSGDPISNHPEHMKAIVVTTSDSVVTGTLSEFIAAVPTAADNATAVWSKTLPL